MQPLAASLCLGLWLARSCSAASSSGPGASEPHQELCGLLSHGRHLATIALGTQLQAERKQDCRGRGNAVLEALTVRSDQPRSGFRTSSNQFATEET